METTPKTIQMTDAIKTAIRNYFTFKSYSQVLMVEDGEVDPLRCYVKIKIIVDYYINNPYYTAVDINFKENVINGYLDLNGLNR